MAELAITVVEDADKEVEVVISISAEAPVLRACRCDNRSQISDLSDLFDPPPLPLPVGSARPVDVLFKIQIHICMIEFVGPILDLKPQFTGFRGLTTC